MYETIKSFLISWNSKNNERQKLQQLYLVIIIVGIFVAGITSLVNADLGHNLVLIAFAAVVVFLTNAVVWNLLKAGLLTTLPTKPRQPRK